MDEDENVMTEPRPDTPLLTEPPAGDRDWITRWFCAAPPIGSRFRVLHDEWHDENGTPVRDIYRIEPPVSETSGQPGGTVP